MILGIVGSEAAKFTPETETKARFEIDILIDSFRPDKIVSGGCHLGGIDVWAGEAALKYGIVFEEFPPKIRSWAGGYRERNMKIAQHSDVVVCITVKEFPPNYTGMRFPYCYHCRTGDHIKSGGCWTVKYARSLGTQGEIIVVC